MRILPVEDEKSLAETVRRGLTNEGFVVDVTHDGARGLWAATENTYDVILLDLMLPIKNGYDLLMELRVVSLPEQANTVDVARTIADSPGASITEFKASRSAAGSGPTGLNLVGVA